MHKIIELNNMAVACICANKFKEAVHSLGWVLQLTKNLLYTMIPPPSSHHKPCLEESSNHDEKPQNPETPNSHHHNHGTIFTTSMGTNDDDNRIIDQQPLFKYSSAIKYQHPFRMLPDMDHNIPAAAAYSRSTTTPLSMSESHTTQAIGLSAIIIFNLALCFDLLASISPNTAKQKMYIAKAISLYEQVVELYLQSTIESNVNEGIMTTTMEQGGESFSCCSPMVFRAQQDMVIMAAINNLVQLYPECAQKEEYFNMMMVLFQEIQRTDYQREEIQRLVNSQARVFVSNTVVLSSNMRLLSISAAAA